MIEVARPSAVRLSRRRHGRRDDLLDLLRPPAHRGPLIAAGAVVLAVGVVLEELRLDDKLPASASTC